MLDEALAAKIDFARSNGLELSIVTQFCFKAEPIVEWLQRLRAHGIDIPVRVGDLATRTFIPHKCHAAIGVLGAVTVGTACVLPGSVASVVVSATEGPVKRLSVEHPSGEFSLEIEVDNTTSTRLQVIRSSLIRTARALFRGDVLVPASIWDGSSTNPPTAHSQTMESP